MPLLRIVLVDDYPIIREGLKAILGSQDQIEVVGEAEDGPKGLAVVAAVDPDVLILDVPLPGLPAATTAERVRQAHPRCKILALSVHDDRGCVQLMLGAGATGYALKRSPAAELVRAVRAVAAGQSYLDPTFPAAVRDDPTPAADSEPAELSHREVEVLRLIAEGYSNKEIAARLSLSVKTVETYKARSMEKLGLRTRVDLMRHAARRGWLSDL